MVFLSLLSVLMDKAVYRSIEEKSNQDVTSRAFSARFESRRIPKGLSMSESAA
jgi:hypothetical protein